MSCEMEKMEPDICQVMDKLPYRVAARIVAIVEITLSLIVFMVLIVSVLLFSTAGQRERGTEESSFWAELFEELGQLFWNILLILIVIVLVGLLAQIGFAVCLLLATSTTSVLSHGNFINTLYS